MASFQTVADTSYWSHVASPSSSAACPLTFKLFNAGTNLELVSTFLLIDPSTGTITVDADTVNTYNLFVRYMYNGGNFDTTAF